MRDISEIFEGIRGASKKIVITCHQKPDGDAMGSMLGLYQFLVQFGHEVFPVSPTNWASFLSWMPGSDKVYDYDSQADAVNVLLEKCDWVFCLDYNTLSRTKNMAGALEAFEGTRILIDHHENPETDKFQYGISVPGKSSTAELVYELIAAMGEMERINQAIAQCLYAGVMTDTGSFRFPVTSASVHRMVAQLKETGFDHSKVHENLFDNFLENRLRFIGNALLNRMEIFYEYNAALISIPRNDLFKYEIKTGDTEGIVNYPLSIRGIKLAALLIDRGDSVKSSFRSKGAFDVNRFARKYFNGGGHQNAAGGRNVAPLEEVVTIFKNALEENKALLS